MKVRKWWETRIFLVSGVLATKIREGLVREDSSTKDVRKEDISEELVRVICL